MNFNQPQNKLPELLAPAGSLESFFAAMEKGADAVYAGLNEFSARAKAKNFTLQQMERMLCYAHGMDRKVYVTLNTLIKENELPGLIDTLAALEKMEVDAVIVQDLAIARLVRRFFPRIPLHASTQMTIHNSPGVLQLAGMGFERVVLARELHLDEISFIVANSPIGIECFIHGALCFSISGQCYFSSFLGGHSGNRGRCAQPCRRQYRYRGKEGYYFSTNDFSSIDILPELVATGVSSLKIEGRMKSAEYVACVVAAYRAVLDAVPGERPKAIARAKELLKLSFGRVPTKGFLVSSQPTDIATPTLRGATGRFLGEIRTLRGDRISFESRDRLHVGDRIRIQPKSDMAGRAFTIKELFVDNRPVKAAPEKSRVTIPSPFGCAVGDAVFKVSSETAFTMSENACQKRLASVQPGKLPCDLQLSLSDGVLTIEAVVAGLHETFTFPLGELETARTSDMSAVLASHFAKTGETPFALKSLAAGSLPPVMIPAARLKELRRDLYRQLAERILPQLAKERSDRQRQARASLVASQPPRGARRAELIVRIEQATDLHLLHRDGIDAVSIPASRANLHQLQQIGRRLRGREEKVLWRLPFIIFDKDIPWYREAVKALCDWGFRRFEAANLSHFSLLAGHDVEIVTDYRLFSLNSQAILGWCELGAVATTLYIEDDADNMGALLSANLPVARRILLYGEVPAITSKIAIKEIKNDLPVLSDRGEGYRVSVRDGLTVVTPTMKFSLTQFREKLQNMGCGSFILDLAHLNRDQQEQVLGAYAAGRELPNSSPFNFTMGLV